MTATANALMRVFGMRPVTGLILAIDPGTAQSGWVLYEGGTVHDSDTTPNAGILRLLTWHKTATVALERFEARGMPMSEDSIETVLWTGRFIEAAGAERVRLVKRSAVKLHLCGSSRAKDPNVRQALIDRFGGKEAAIGKKAKPGPLYGVTSHAWAALAVAVTAADAGVPAC